MKPPRVLLCGYDYPQPIGGVESWIQRAWPEIAQRGVEVRALFFSARCRSGKSTETLRAAGIEVALGASRWPTEEKIRFILDQCRRAEIDVFVPNCVVPAYFASGHLAKAGIPCLGVLHSDDPFHHALLAEFGAPPDSPIAAWVAVSRHLAAAARRTTKSSVTVEEIGYGIAVADSNRARQPGTPFRLIYVGRFEEEQKRISAVTAALLLTTRAVPETAAWMIGTGSRREAVEAATRGTRVEVLGLLPLAEVELRLREAHALVLLSDYEGLPISVLEAMAAGVVPICRRIASGIPELIEDGRNGLLVADDPGEVAAAVAALAGDAAYWQRLSEGAQAAVRADHSLSISADRWAALLQRIAGSAGEKQPFVTPRWLALPPVRAEFAREDLRCLDLAGRLRELGQAVSGKWRSLERRGG